jgi:hypothetical protein
MGEASPFKELDDYENGPDDQCVVHFLDEQEIEGTPHVCKLEVGKRICYAVGLNREGIITLDGLCQSLNRDNTAMHFRN